MISDVEQRRKLELATYEFIADITIVDPALSAQMPPQLTADTGIDALTHAVEACNNAWSNDFSDGLCLQAAKLVFGYLPRAVADGDDLEAREKMSNAATLGGLVITNTNISLAHALSHSAGALFHLPHGRVTGLILPLTVEYLSNGGVGRYTEMAHVLGLCEQDSEDSGARLAKAIRGLLLQIGQPLSLQEMRVPRQLFEAELEALCDRTEMDAGLVMAPRIPDREEMKRLFECAYTGASVDF
jgi:alcohol dehydrogenase class IV